MTSILDSFIWASRLNKHYIMTYDLAFAVTFLIYKALAYNWDSFE